MNKKVEIYTDGSSLGNPGPGGYGAVVVEVRAKSIKDGSPDASVEAFREIIHEIGGGEKDTTNNRMEIMAVIETLKYLIKSKIVSCEIHADSSYVLGGVTSWIENWEKNGWRTANKKPVMNQDLWRELITLIREYKGTISWQKVKGHSGHVHNDRADELATSFASKYKK